MAIERSRIRNLGFVGDAGVGKTSLVEAILHRTGMTNRLGRVDDGTATTDFDPEEVKRKISINTAVAFCDYRDHLADFEGLGVDVLALNPQPLASHERFAKKHGACGAAR